MELIVINVGYELHVIPKSVYCMPGPHVARDQHLDDARSVLAGTFWLARGKHYVRKSGVLRA